MPEKATAKEKIFFPNLDGLRFFCFFIVFLYHCNEAIFRRISNANEKATVNFLFQNGNTGVNIFFVLSGFLITFLLIKEKEINGTIVLKNFYIRRVLRIWPLYYLCVFFGFVIFSYAKYKAVLDPHLLSNIKYYAVFASNFDVIKIWPQVGAASLIVLWSVSVEEQFYVTWPILLKYAVTKAYPYIFCGLIIFTLIFRSFYLGNTDMDYAMRYFHTFSVIGDMALGGLMAYYCSYDSIVLRFIQKMPRWQIALLYMVTLIVLFFKQTIFSFPFLMMIERLVLAVLFALIIAEQNYAENSFFKFSSLRKISQLGVYTYGFYCLHFIAILTVLAVADKYNWLVNTLLATVVACLAALVLTILMALASYHFFEKYFLGLKNKFSFIVKK